MILLYKIDSHIILVCYSKLVSHFVQDRLQSQPKEVSVHRLDTSDLIRTHCRALAIHEIDKLELEGFTMPPKTDSQNEANVNTNRDRTVYTITASTDGLLYVPLFCCGFDPIRTGILIDCLSTSPDASHSGG